MRVLVSGAGIAGCTLAYFLRRDGADVQLIDRAAEHNPVGSMTTMYGEGMSVAERMGVLPRLKELSHQQSSQVLHNRRGDVIRTYDLDQAHALQRGMLTLRRSDWQAELSQAASALVAPAIGTTVTGMDVRAGSVHVSLSDGSSDTYDAVIAADGVRSSTRAMAFPDTDHRRPLGISLATLILDDAGELRAKAELAPHRVHEWFLPGRYAEISTLSETSIALILVARTPPSSKALGADERLLQLRSQFRDMPPQVLQVLDGIDQPERVYHDDLAQVFMPQWHRGAFVLVGDAAHALTPMLGVGGSKAMRGAYEFAGALRRHHGDVHAAATEYEATTRSSVERLQRATRQMAGLALASNPAIIAFRNTLFTRLPERLVVRLRSAPPPGTEAFDDR